MAVDAIDVFRVRLISGVTALFLTDFEPSFMYIYLFSFDHVFRKNYNCCGNFEAF